MNELKSLSDHTTVLKVYVGATNEAYAAILLSHDDTGAEIHPRQEYKNRCIHGHAGRNAWLCIEAMLKQLIPLDIRCSVVFVARNAYLWSQSKKIDDWEKSRCYLNTRTGKPPKDVDVLQRIGPLKQVRDFIVVEAENRIEDMLLKKAHGLARSERPKPPKYPTNFQASSWDAR